MIRGLAKTPYEKFPIYFNYGPKLQTTETLASYVLTCVNAITGVDSSADIIVSDSLTGGKVKVVITGGVNGATHKISCLGTSDIGNDFDIDLYLIIDSDNYDYHEKQVSDEFTIRNDFSDDFESGDTISTRTVTAVKQSDLSTSTSTVIQGSSIENPYIYAGVKGGANGDYHKVSIKIVSASGYKYEKLVMLSVKEK